MFVVKNSFMLIGYKEWIYGRCAKGENGQGIAMNIISNAILNQISMVLNFPLSVCLRFATAEPIVIITIADSINNKCITPKKKGCVICPVLPVA